MDKENMDGFTIAVTAPQMGATISEFVVAELSASAGDVIRKGQTLATLESDKSIFDFESPCDGIVITTCSKVGEVIIVGAPLFLMKTLDDSVRYLECKNSGNSIVLPKLIFEPTDERGSRLFTNAESPALGATEKYPIGDLTSTSESSIKQSSMIFHFGDGCSAENQISVHPDMFYNEQRGFGFEFGSQVFSVLRTVKNEISYGFISSAYNFSFSTKALEGNYNVILSFGDKQGKSSTTVRAESRRLMLENITTRFGEVITRCFTVNIRNPKLPVPPMNAPGGTQVTLSNRELLSQGPALQWDDKLTLKFSGAHPCISTLKIERENNAITLYLAGDSTVSDHLTAPYSSWGQMLPRFFKNGVAVANHAEGGATLKSFISDLRLAKILSQVRKGDYLFIQFGHADQKEYWPQTYVEANSTYKTYLKTYISEARHRGAIPVLVTPMHRNVFDDLGNIKNTLGDYPKAMREVAKEVDVSLVDLNLLSEIFYQALGPKNVDQAFANAASDPSHHSEYGGYELAKCVVESIKTNHPPLAKFVVDDFSTFDPAKPDLFWEWTLSMDTSDQINPNSLQAVVGPAEI